MEQRKRKCFHSECQELNLEDFKAQAGVDLTKKEMAKSMILLED